MIIWFPLLLVVSWVALWWISSWKPIMPLPLQRYPHALTMLFVDSSPRYFHHSFFHHLIRLTTHSPHYNISLAHYHYGDSTKYLSGMISSVGKGHSGMRCILQLRRFSFMMYFIPWTVVCHLERWEILRSKGFQSTSSMRVVGMFVDGSLSQKYQ